MEKSDILNKLNLPDFVKQDIVGRIKPYLEAIEIDGCSKIRIRKVIVLGNKGIFRYNRYFGVIGLNYFSMSIHINY